MAASRIRRTPFERIEYAIICSTLLLMVVVTVQPILNLLAVSLSDSAEVPGMSGLAVLPHGFSLDVWQVLLTHPQVLRGLANSLLITIAGTVINVVATTLMAWALSRQGLPGRRAILVFVLVTVVFEPGVVPDYLVMKQLGLLNSYWSVILYRGVFAWYLIVLIRFFEEIPKELMEAAEIEGASPLQTLWYVVAPLALPAIATITLFYTVLHWNEYFRAMIYLNDPKMWPLQVVLRQFVVEGDKSLMVGLDAMNKYTGGSQIDLRALKAGMIILTLIPVLAIYPLILKFFTKGTMSGAVKG